MLKQLRMARQANRLRALFEELWDSPTAYRPQVPAGATIPPRMPAIHALHAISNFANQRRSTAGDAGVLATELLAAIDDRRSYAKGFDDVMDRIVDGSLKAVTGRELRTLLHPDAVAEILEAIGSAGRTEAWTNYVLANGGSA